MSDMKMQAAVEMSVEQPVKALDQIAVAAEKMAGKVDKAASKAGESVDGIGTVAGASADQLTRAEGRMVASIKKIQTQMDLAGKTASQKFEFNIAAKGLDASKFEPMLAKMRETEIAQARLAAGSVDLLAKFSGLAVGAVAAVAAFKGVASSMMEAQQESQKLKNSLEYAAGGVTGAAKEIQYLREVTNQLGLDFSTSSQAYAKFAAATKESGVSLSQTKIVFEGVAAASAKLGLSADETQGALLALSQMASKGTVSAEELRGQLGERLPGAFNIAAKSMGLTTAELGKMMEAGQLMASDFLPKFGQALKDNFQAPLSSLTQEINRFSSAWTLWKMEMSEGTNGGGLKWLTNGLNESTASMRSLGAEAGITLKILAAIGGFNAGAVGSAKMDAVQAQAKAMQQLPVVRAQREDLESKDYLTQFEKQTLSDLKRQEAAIRQSITDLAVQRGKESGINLPDLAGEYVTQQKKQADTLKAYLNDSTNGSKAAKSSAALAKENAAFNAAVSAYSETDKRYQSALVEHNLRVAEIEKAAKGSDSAKNDGSQKYAAALAAEKEYSSAQIKIINSRVAAGVDSEEDGIKQVLAAQISGYTKEYALLTEQIAKTKDVGDKAKLGQQLTALGSGMQVAASEYQSALAKIEKAREKYMQSQTELADNSAYKIEQENIALREQIDVLGLTDKQLGEHEAAKVRVAAAASYLDAANLREAASQMEAAGVVSDAIPYYRQLADAREAAGKALDQKSLLESEKGMKKAAVDAANEWKKTADKIGDSITDALMRGFESGKTFAEALRDTVVNMFNTMVLKPVIQVTVMGGLSAIGMGSALAGDSSSVLGMASTGNSLYNAVSGGASSMYTGFATSGIGQSLGLGTAPAYYAAGDTMIGSGLTELGSSLGSALPYVGLAAAAASLLASAYGSGGTPHAGGIVFSTPTGTVTPNTAAGIDSVYKDANGVRLGDQFAENDWTESFSKSVADSLTPTAETINGILNSAATTFGKKAGYTTGLAFSSDGEDDSRGRLGIVDGAGVEVAQIMERYSSDAATGIQELIGAAGGSVRQALDAMNLPGWANEMLSALGSSPSVDSLAATVAQINAIATAAKTLAPAFQMAEADFAKIYLKAGADAVNAYYTATTTAAEKQAAQLNQITDAFGALGYSLPDSIESFRALAESQDATTAAGQNTIASLMGLTAGFAQFRASVDGLQSSASSAIDAFRTSDQVLSKNQQTLADLSAKAGIAIPTMASELVDMFDSIDFANPTTEGLALAAALPGIASAFSSVSQAAKAAEEAAKATAAATAAAHSALLQSAQDAIGAAVDSDYSALERAVAAQKTSLETAYSAQDAINQSAITASTKIRDNLSSLADTLKKAVGTITADADSNLLASRNAAQAVLNNAYAASQSGQSLDPYSESIKSAITELSKPSDQLYSTYEEYARTQGRANAAISALSVAAGDQLDVADLTLKAIKDAAYSAEESYKKALADLDATLENAKAQIDALRGINTSVLSVKDAIDALALSLAAAAGTKVAPTASTVGKWTSTNDGQYYQSSAGAVLTRAAGSSDTIIHTADGYSGTVAQAVASVNSQTAEQVYAATKEAGLTLSELNQIMGWDAGRAENWARENNLPTFAVGTNYVPADMTAQIHQGERIIPAADNREIMSRLAANDSSSDLLAELKALREEVNLLRYEARATATNTNKAAKALEKFDNDGMPAERIAA